MEPVVVTFNGLCNVFFSPGSYHQVKNYHNQERIYDPSEKQENAFPKI